MFAPRLQRFKSRLFKSNVYRFTLCPFKNCIKSRWAYCDGFWESKWITGTLARQDVQHWRAISGAVITGIQTVLADDCELNVRILEGVDLSTVVQPKRIILDRQGQLPPTAKILQNPETVMVMTPFRQELADLGVIQLSPQPLNQLLRTLSQQYQIYDVLVEAGATLSTAFYSKVWLMK